MTERPFRKRTLTHRRQRPPPRDTPRRSAGCWGGCSPSAAPRPRPRALRHHRDATWRDPDPGVHPGGHQGERQGRPARIPARPRWRPCRSLERLSPHLQPGPDHRRAGRALGAFMNLSGPTFTDSGGFQCSASAWIQEDAGHGCGGRGTADDVIAEGKDRLRPHRRRRRHVQESHRRIADTLVHPGGLDADPVKLKKRRWSTSGSKPQNKLILTHDFYY